MFKQNNAISISVYYSLIFMGNGAINSYISLYYADMQLGNGQIGILTSIGPFVAILAQPFWGIISDRSSVKNKILFLCLLASSINIWLIPSAGKEFWLLSMSIATFYFFQCSVNPLSDSISLELAARENLRFSNIRTAGSLGFAIMSAITGNLVKNNIKYIFPIFSVLMLLAFLISFLIPHVKGHQSKKDKVNLSVIFKNRRLRYIYAYVFILSVTSGFFNAFNGVYSKQVGISTSLLGIAIMIGCFGEFPFMLLFDKAYKKLGIVNIMLISGVIHCFRWGLYATALSAKTLFILWILHGSTFIVLYLCLAEYVSKHLDEKLKTSGQMMNSLILSGVSRIVGSFFGGIVSSAIGFQYSFAIASFLAGAAVVAFFIVVKTSEVFKDKVESEKSSVMDRSGSVV